MNAIQGGLSARINKQLDHTELRMDLNVPAGSTLMLIGPSGSGKTTVLRCLAGLESIDQGWIFFNGQCWNESRSKYQMRTRHRNIGFLAQDYALFPHMSLEENIGFVLPDKEDAKAHLAAMGIDHLAKKRPHQISGGERQRAALCQTLARRPRLLLLDEPFSALDIENRSLLRELLNREQHRLGLTIIQVTHDLTEALASGAQVIALRQGQEDPHWLTRQRELLLQDLKHVDQDAQTLAA
ncbi:ATP-binding cassette domain-containing protein [Desulfobulbus rhabdoformis]|uniref:ATP-binding cassette domain-containing protein n=1 Tax=Desulfobulbus rhabdoformis TaxID=34032 RepID=UPI0019639766|nr:ATP-binding cassette domain-containing protein [Desulfobulbus rhabdoformis]MBM9615539.1 ATP-binding cassette domain-containing protein [Desulfobulbus rhabdoformis]